MCELQDAWSRREKRGLLAESEALRIFHGPGEGVGDTRDIAIDRFGDHYWVTQWESPEMKSDLTKRVTEFLGGIGARSAVMLRRPAKGVPAEASAILGAPPAEAFAVAEGRGRFLIRLIGVTHPGLFLDHAPLRTWLAKHSREWKVLNTFAYTGSLSVAAGLGGASHVTTLDLSKTTLDWARENWKCNGLSEGSGRFISGDVFEWLPRLKRSNEKFDCVILDPPSFSRGKKGSFSTAKDLEKLHELAMRVLGPQGVLITSINSSNVTWKRFETDVASAAKSAGREFEVLHRIELPESFPVRPEAPEEGYLKGWVLKAR